MENTDGRDLAATNATPNSYIHASSVQNQLALPTPVAPMYWMSSVDSRDGLVVTNGPTMVGALMVMLTFLENVVRSVGRYAGSAWNSPTPWLTLAEPW